MENRQLLSCIFNSLGRPDHPLYRLLAHDGYPREYQLLAFEDALRSGDVPLRGRRQGFFHLAPYECIEPNIDAEMAIDIALDGITLCKYCQEGPLRIEVAVFRRVQADMAGVERWIRENLAKATGGVSEDAVEAECRLWLAALPEDRRIAKKQTFELFNQFRRNAGRKIIGLRTFNLAWRKSAPLPWRTPGRLPGA